MSRLREDRGYHHAKAIYLETESGEEILINGNADISSPAWLDGGRRSCESVVVADRLRLWLFRVKQLSRASCRVLVRIKEIRLR